MIIQGILKKKKKINILSSNYSLKIKISYEDKNKIKKKLKNVKFKTDELEDINEYEKWIEYSDNKVRKKLFQTETERNISRIESYNEKINSSNDIDEISDDTESLSFDEF